MWRVRWHNLVYGIVSQQSDGHSEILLGGSTSWQAISCMRLVDPYGMCGEGPHGKPDRPLVPAIQQPDVNGGIAHWP